ncbi:MAG: acyltransferase [Hyphomicrobiaceae bacterium]
MEVQRERSLLPAARAAHDVGSAKTRLAYLDGLRGVAIGMVLVFHAYARWAHLMPFGATFAVPPLAQGWVGVELFFIISGFVIFLTLERSRSLGDFALRRWRRLMPAMLVATALIVVTAPLLPERPQGAVRLADVLVGLTFLDPKWWLSLHMEVAPIEGAFWSLFVEVQFYAVAGLAYFIAGRRGALAALIGLYGAVVLLQAGAIPQGPFLYRAAFALTDRLGALYYPWFIAGALLYVFAETRERHWLWLGVAALAAAVVTSEPAGPWLAGKLAFAAVALLFLAALLWPRLQRSLSGRGVQFLGFVSYPLYLVHENAVVALTVKLGHAAPVIPGWALPLLPMLAVVAVAWWIARYGEPAVRRALTWRPQRHGAGMAGAVLH